MMAAKGSRVAHNRLSPRSAATRAKLITVAERLFAKHGIEGVTLAQIGKAAGQRNAAVCQYHFGNKNGLLQSIIDKHVPGIVARRHAMLEEIERQDAPPLREIARALVAPVAEKLDDPRGGREFIIITAQLVALHSVASLDLGASPLRLPGGDRLARALKAALAPQRLAHGIVKQRTVLAAVVLFHGLADHLRMLDLANRDDEAFDTPLFVRTLEESVAALLAGCGTPSATKSLGAKPRQAP